VASTGLIGAQTICLCGWSVPLMRSNPSREYLPVRGQHIERTQIYALITAIRNNGRAWQVSNEAAKPPRCLWRSGACSGPLPQGPSRLRAFRAPLGGRGGLRSESLSCFGRAF
jgi:hypothetical protein